MVHTASLAASSFGHATAPGNVTGTYSVPGIKPADTLLSVIGTNAADNFGYAIAAGPDTGQWSATAPDTVVDPTATDWHGYTISFLWAVG